MTKVVKIDVAPEQIGRLGGTFTLSEREYDITVLWLVGKLKVLFTQSSSEDQLSCSLSLIVNAMHP